MTRPTLSCWLWLALLAACGGSATVASTETTADAVDIQPPAPEPEATDYLPADTYLLVTVDVARLRSSPYYPMVVETLKATDEIGAAEEEALHSMVERTSRMWFAGVPNTGGRGGDLGCILFEGDYEPGQPEAALRALVPDNADFVETEIAGHAVIEGQGGMLAQLGGRAWIMGEPARVRAVLQSPPGGFAAMADPAWSEARQWLQQPEAAVQMVALGTTALHHDLSRNSPLDPAAPSHIRSVAGALDVSDGMAVEVMALTDDGAVAAGMAQWARDTVGQLRQNMIVSMLSLGPVLDGIDARAEGMTAGVRVRVADGEVRRLLGMLPNMLAQ